MGVFFFSFVYVEMAVRVCACISGWLRGGYMVVPSSTMRTKTMCQKICEATRRRSQNRL